MYILANNLFKVRSIRTIHMKRIITTNSTQSLNTFYTLSRIELIVC